MGTPSKMDRFMVGEATTSETDLQTPELPLTLEGTFFTSSQGNNVQPEAQGLTSPSIHATGTGPRDLDT